MQIRRRHSISTLSAVNAFNLGVISVKSTYLTKPQNLRFLSSRSTATESLFRPTLTTSGYVRPFLLPHAPLSQSPSPISLPRFIYHLLISQRTQKERPRLTNLTSMILPPLNCLFTPADAKKKPKWSFLFFKKKPTETPKSIHKTESMVMLQKHVAISSAKK